MTKDELLDAITNAPAGATVYIHTGDGVLRSRFWIDAHIGEDQIVLELEAEDTEDEADE